MRSTRTWPHIASVFAILCYVVLAGTCEFSNVDSALPNFLPEAWRGPQLAAFLAAPGVMAGAILYALVCAKRRRRLTPFGAFVYGFAAAILEWFCFLLVQVSPALFPLAYTLSALMAFGTWIVGLLVVLLVAWGLVASADWFGEWSSRGTRARETSV